jgi:tetratricopeptide (TPR) repeat protein
MKTYQLILVSALLFMIIGAPTIRFNSMMPAPMDVPQSIKSIGLIDASITDDKLKNVIERGLSLELPNQDKVASQFALEGLFGFLNNNQRFTVVKTPKAYFNSSMKAVFPETMAWEEIEKLCETYKVDAIISLEFFDSDYNLITNLATVHMGFRLYDPVGRQIIDQHRFTHQVAFTPPQKSVVGVINRAIEKNQVLQEVSFTMGEMYGRRLAPTWIRIVREYYQKPRKNNNLAIGARMMEANDWPSAINYLEKAVDTGNRKSSGRAAHNLAVVYEILGDYDKAKEWAQQAWGIYRNKGSKNYAYQLSQRKQEIERLRQQEEN